LSKPTILLSSCKGPEQPGDGKYNGGVKNYNMWAKLLKQHGYDAYIVTWDGSYDPWLCEYQPYIDIYRAAEIAQEGNAILVTTWLDSPAILNLFETFYYNDHEIHWSHQYRDLLHLYLHQDRIKRVAVTNQLAVMWYMERYKIKPDLIQVWYDRDYWIPRPSKRVIHRIGYMIENTCQDVDMAQEAQFVADHCRRCGFDIELFPMSGGNEADLIEMMQTCDIYIGLGQGKHPLWGEGGPAMHIEAMLAGVVVVAYDSGGNHEYLINGYSGFVVPRGNVRNMANQVVNLLRHPNIRERVRWIGSAFAARNFTSQVRWPQVAQFLRLPREAKEDEFANAFGFD